MYIYYDLLCMVALKLQNTPKGNSCMIKTLFFNPYRLETSQCWQSPSCQYCSCYCAINFIFFPFWEGKQAENEINPTVAA